MTEQQLLKQQVLLREKDLLVPKDTPPPGASESHMQQRYLLPVCLLPLHGLRLFLLQRFPKA